MPGRKIAQSRDVPELLNQTQPLTLQPGESKVVELSVPANSLAFVGQDGKWCLEKGAFRLMAGDRHVDVNCVADKVWKGQNIE